MILPLFDDDDDDDDNPKLYSNNNNNNIDDVGSKRANREASRANAVAATKKKSVKPMLGLGMAVRNYVFVCVLLFFAFSNFYRPPYFCLAACASTPDFSLKGALEVLLCSDLVNNNALCDTYKGVIKRFLNGILDPGVPIVGVCTGEFTGAEIKDQEGTKDMGCNDIPIADTDDKDFGVVAGRFRGGITKVNTKYCSITAPPDCGFLWAMSFDLGLSKWLLENSPGFFGFPSPAVAFFEAILALSAPLNELAFGISERGGFEVPLNVYTQDGFQSDMLLANFFFKNGITTQFLPDDVNAVLPTTDGGATYWAWNEDAQVNVNGIFNGNLDPMVLGLQYSTANIRQINAKFRLSRYTGGIVPDIDLLRATEIGYMVRDDLGVLGGLEPGYYTSYGLSVPFIGSNAKLFCDFFGGLDIFECPEPLEFDVSSRFGWYQELYTQNLGFGFEWFSQPLVECLFDANVGLSCESDGDSFLIETNTAGVRAVSYKAGVQTKSVEISKDAYEKLGNFSVASLDYFEGVTAMNKGSILHELGGNRKLDNVDSSTESKATYGFRSGHGCIPGEGDATIFDTSDVSSFDAYSVQYGHDGSLRNCFSACVLRAMAPDDSGETPVACCEYRAYMIETMPSHGACVVRASSALVRSTDDDGAVYASTSFATDFKTIAGNYR